MPQVLSTSAAAVRIRTVIVTVLLLVAAARSIWLSFTALAVATPVHGDVGREQLDRMERYRDLHDALTGLERVGYLGEVNATASEPYHYARLAALPTLVTPSADEAIVVADSAGPDDLQRIFARGRWRVRERLSDDLMILERTR